MLRMRMRCVKCKKIVNPYLNLIKKPKKSKGCKCDTLFSEYTTQSKRQEAELYG